MNEKETVNDTLQILKKHFHNERKTTLNRLRVEKDPFKILIGCIVSINIKDEVTEKILEALFLRIKNFGDIIAIPTEELEEMLYLARYRRVKAATLKSISREIIERFNGRVPSTKEELLSIKGIGGKTANVVLNFAYDLPYIPVDSNTVRITNRLGWIATDKNEEVEKLLVENLESNFLKEANALFMLHGTTICVPVSPFCSRCPVERICRKIDIKNER